MTKILKIEEPELIKPAAIVVCSVVAFLKEFSVVSITKLFEPSSEAVIGAELEFIVLTISVDVGTVGVPSSATDISTSPSSRVAVAVTVVLLNPNLAMTPV